MEFNITISEKTQYHPFFSMGSNLGYYIDNLPGETLKLSRGSVYKFKINTPGNPFYFTTDKQGGAGYPLLSLMDDQDQIIETGTLTWRVPSYVPSHFYYQSITNSYVGGNVIIE